MKRIILGIWLLVASFAGAQSALAATPPASWNLPIPQSFGVNIHFGDDHLPAEIADLKQVGIGWVRRDMFWEEVEHHKGIYNFTLYDHLINALHDAGIRTVMILDYTNFNYDGGNSPATPQTRAAFARFAAESARRYAGKVDAWEIYNEPNHEFWKPRADAGQYIQFASEVTAAIRNAVPDAVIIGPALAGPTADDEAKGADAECNLFMDRVLGSSAARSWNAITVHPYRWVRQTPEESAAQLDMTREMMRRHGIDPTNIPLIAGEWGYSTWLRGVDEATQAAYAVRTFLWAGIEHMPFTIWYDWQDDGKDSDNAEHRFGLLRGGPLGINAGPATPESKPAYNAVRQLSAMLHGYRFDSLVQKTDSFLIARYVNGTQTAYAAWSLDDSPHTVTLTLAPGNWQATYILGKTTGIIAVAGQGSEFTASQMPLIIHTQ